MPNGYVLKLIALEGSIHSYISVFSLDCGGKLSNPGLQMVLKTWIHYPTDIRIIIIVLIIFLFVYLYING